MYKHIQNAYASMLKKAKKHKTPEGETVVIYEGFHSVLFQTLGLKGPQLVQVVRLLEATGAAQQLSRGAGKQPSRWLLHKNPSLSAFKKARTKLQLPTTQQQRTSDMTIALNVLIRRVEILENALEAHVKGIPIALIPGEVEQYDDRESGHTGNKSGNSRIANGKKSDSSGGETAPKGV